MVDHLQSVAGESFYELRTPFAESETCGSGHDEYQADEYEYSTEYETSPPDSIAASELEHLVCEADEESDQEEFLAHGEWEVPTAEQEWAWLTESEIDGAHAVARNRHWGVRLNWRSEFDAIVRLLGYTDMTPGELAFSEAIARWQAANGLAADGIIGPATWAAIRARLAPASTTPARSNRLRSSSWLRSAWSPYLCQKSDMVWITILSNRTPVNPLTPEAWRALDQALNRTGYRATRVWNYNCRNIRGKQSRSLHSYGLALDIDSKCHPNIKTADRRLVRFSSAATQAARCDDVRAGRADTGFTPEQVAAVEAIRTASTGVQVFAWGGRWQNLKDSMHFQINVSPAELREGIS